MRLKIITDASSEKLFTRIAAAASAATNFDILCEITPGKICANDFVLSFCYCAVPSCYLIGNRIYNRRQRLELLDNLSVPVVPWAPTTELEAVAEVWGDDNVVYKSDASFMGRGVYLVKKDDPRVRTFKPQRDVLMRFIPDCSHVLKVYFLHDVIVSSYLWRLPSLTEENFVQRVRADAQKPVLARLLTSLPATVQQTMKSVMVEMCDKFMGFCSVDFMLYNGDWAVIELNTSGVGTGVIAQLDKNWENKFSLGLGSLAADLHRTAPPAHLKFCGIPYAC